jgi:hypothetical protein
LILLIVTGTPGSGMTSPALDFGRVSQNIGGIEQHNGVEARIAAAGVDR